MRNNFWYTFSKQFITDLFPVIGHNRFELPGNKLRCLNMELLREHKKLKLVNAA
jgi:hypothetical protein